MPCLSSSTGTLLTCWLPSEERTDVALTWHCAGRAWPVQKSSWKQHHVSQYKVKNMRPTSRSSCSMSCIYDLFVYSSAAMITLKQVEHFRCHLLSLISCLSSAFPLCTESSSLRWPSSPYILCICFSWQLKKEVGVFKYIICYIFT